MYILLAIIRIGVIYFACATGLSVNEADFDDGVTAKVTQTLDHIVKVLTVHPYQTPRSANTCADPSLAKVIFQGFHGSTTIHLLNVHYQFVISNTINQLAYWTDLQPAFIAWTTPQDFTVPLFQLANAARTEYIYMIGPDAATAPIVSGFTTDVGVIAWVYNTPVCGSVPLLGVTSAAATDHYYTTDPDVRTGMIGSGAGWTDTGIAAYVLPLRALG